MKKISLIRIKDKRKKKYMQKISYPKVILGEIRGDEIIKMSSVQVEHQ